MALAPLLGAPGVRVAFPEPVRAVTGVRRDIAAFAGVSPRGPARLPPVALEPDDDVGLWLAGPRQRSVAVAVTSWDEYRQRFGGFEGPGRLPYAVSAFFAQGGERAWVVRIVHDHGDPVVDDAGCAAGPLGSLVTTDGDTVIVRARDEGSWGNTLRGTLSFATRPVPVIEATTAELVVARDQSVPVGSLVRVRSPGDVLELRYVDRSETRPHPTGPGTRRHLTLDVPLAAVPVAFEVVTGRLAVADHDLSFPRTEVVADVGLRADHPRWLARALIEDSTLVWPDASWAAGAVVAADPTLPPVVFGPLTGGVDRWPQIVPEDFWDGGWVLGDEAAASGVHCLAENEEVGLLVAPDLYEPVPLAPLDDVTDPPSVAGPEFEVCVPLDPPAPADPPPLGLDGLALDPLVPSELDRIVANQQALVTFADQRRDLTVLLDVPLGLPPRRALDWRNAFDSPYVAAYHPWLDVAAPDDARDALVRVNPSAFAAGIIAERERRLGVQHGPSNQVAQGAVRVSAAVPLEVHDELHLEGVNVFRAKRDGIRLTAARTLSRRRELRQLNVARLMVVLRLSLERDMDWATFEPNGDALWGEVRRMVEAFLTRLFEAGAFAGATTREAFFVRCDRTTMTRNDLDEGRFVCLVGVAPSEPVEYLVLELSRDRDTSVRAEVGAGA
jgi:hypothetical protein